jgi:hypothetical protein
VDSTDLVYTRWEVDDENAGLIISVVILRSQSFGKVAGYVGVVGFVLALANYISWIVAPSVAAMLMPVNGLLWLIWWLIMSVGLFRLAKDAPDQGADATVG